ncbi:HAD-superfamily phosphatase [Annulohypoxylon maeteangense]|uniref:HAD-superfamily phosphatase n=1 Tax=Annulohypoxylon maeteangense TaxID=1927788 RepID=UPI002007F1AB|nr:HAD-superfamily phosphatase [Annulohypoxylon maeteangense]KAI0884324.1 HAD-superfamily phosphatase [Annulohypoxylon maeteangense]
MNLNLSGTINVFKLLAKPSLCLPHATVSTFNEIPSPFKKVFEGHREKVDIRAVVLDKDDCFAYPNTNEIYPAYVERFQLLKKEFPGHRLLIVSNTAGATTYDRDGNLANGLQEATGISVLAHGVKKPGCGDEIMAHFKAHPEVGVTNPSQIAIVGDRLMTDMMLANMMGSWGLWIKDGVKPLNEKSVFSKLEQRLKPFLTKRGYRAFDPRSPFE